MNLDMDRFIEFILMSLDDIEKNVEFISIAIQYLENVLPTKIFLKQDRYISPLKLKYLRESSTELIFKYGKRSFIDATVVGKVTRIFDSLDATILDGSMNVTSYITKNIIDVALNSIMIIKKGDIIISPVAIYFE